MGFYGVLWETLKAPEAMLGGMLHEVITFLSHLV